MNPKSILNILPDDIWKWKYVEAVLERVANLADFREIRTSILQDRATLEHSYKQATRFSENTSLDDFLLHVSGTDDLTLRPESTITILRSEAARRAHDEVQKFWYNGPVFRRSGDVEHYQIHQFGFEILGNGSLIADVEIMKVAMRICRMLGLRHPHIELTSYGCHECRPAYLERMREYLHSLPQESCHNCEEATLFNPDRRFQDCDSEECRQLTDDAPRITDNLCPDCRDNLARVTRVLSNLMIEYRLNPYLSRPFGYYNRTVFNIMAQNTDGPIVLGGGGRYDYLSRVILEEDIPAVGFTFNLLKLIHLLEAEDLFPVQERPFTVYICARNDGLDLTLLQIEQELHDEQFHTLLVSTRYDSVAARNEAERHGCSVALHLDEEMIRRGKVRLLNIVKEFEEVIDLAEILSSVQRLQKAIELV